LLNADVYAVAIPPGDPKVVFAGAAANGLLKSNDGGHTWTRANSGLTNFYVRTIVFNPFTPTEMYLGTYAGGGVFKSTNGGISWTLSNAGFPGNPSVYQIVVHPQQPNVIYAPQYGSSMGYAVMKSVDSGSTWITSSVGITTSYGQAIAIDASSPLTMYVGTDKGLFKSVDGGLSWTIAISGLTNLNVVAINIEPLTPTIVYAATLGGVFKSTDGGDNWTAKNVGLSGGVSSMTRDTSGTTNNWYVTTGSSLYVSTNGVESWTLVTNTGAGTARAAAIRWPYGYVGTSTQGVFVRQLNMVYLPLILR
jgi:photosystem II stability/assembly factor-like uncharacterized protein